MTPRLAALALAVFLPACRGEKIARVELTAPGTAETKFPYAGKRAVVWADVDAKWAGPKNSKPAIVYDVEVLQGGSSLGRVVCSTNEHGGTSVCGSHTDFMGSHDADCEYALDCALPAMKPGEVTVRVTGRTGANVKSVKSMALNLREE